MIVRSSLSLHAGSDISRFFGLSLETLFEINNPDIKAQCNETGILANGTTICMRDDEAAPPKCALYYEVDVMDTCDSIIARNHIALDQLYAMNRGLDCRRLPYGDVVCVRDYGVARSPSLAACLKSDQVGQYEDEMCGDIARAHNISMEQFLDLNPGFDCSLSVSNGTSYCLERAPVTSFMDDISAMENPNRIDYMSKLTAAIYEETDGNHATARSVMLRDYMLNRYG